LGNADKTVDPDRVNCPVVLACDEGYAMPLATALRSIVEANRKGWPLDFHVLSDGFSEDTRKKVSDSLPNGSGSIRWVYADLGLFEEFSTMPYISKMTYARFLIPRIFPETVSRVLYLDADLLVLEDLERLWGTDLKGAVVGAVLDGLDQRIKSGELGLEEVPHVRDYFNAGVLLIDLDRWRKERISERALEYLNQHPRSPYSDQDALNVVCDGLWKKLDPRWNFQNHLGKRLSNMGAEERPGIVHFVWRFKPWDIGTLSVNAFFYDLFRSRTCFARTPREILWDTLQRDWSRLKGLLGRSAFL
jgi:lipopolysaccharide biosynthesis glycosyltransferase